MCIDWNETQCDLNLNLTSLVLPCSGMQTLKLCMHEEPGIFSHVKSPRVERLCVGIPETQNMKKSEGSGKMYLAIGRQKTLSYTPSIELCAKRCLSFFSPISIVSCLHVHRKDTRLSPRIHIHILGEPGNEARLESDYFPWN